MRHRHGQTNPAFEDDVHLSDIQRDKSFVMENAAESGRGSGNSTPSTVSPEQSPVLRN